MEQPSHNAKPSSTIRPWWCRWCGADLLNNTRTYCSKTCVTDALADARARGASYHEKATLKQQLYAERQRGASP